MSQNPLNDRFANLEIETAPASTEERVMNQIDTDTYSVERQGLGGCDDRVAQKVDGVWHNAIGLESTETHRHIALDWQKQCIPFPTIRDSVMEEAKGKQDILIPESQVRLRGNLTLPDGTPMTDHALGALAQFAGMPPKVLSYLRDHDDKELAKFLNTDLDQREIDWAKGKKAPRNYLLRNRMEEIDNDGEKSQREITRHVGSGRYGVLDNADVMNILSDVFGNAVDDMLVCHAEDDGDNMRFTCFLPDYIKAMPDSDWAVGFQVTNSEIGELAFELADFLLRAVCFNGSQRHRRDNAVKIRVKHYGKIDKVDLRMQVRHKADVALAHGEKLLAQYQHSQAVKVLDQQRLIAYFAKTNKLTQEQGQAWVKGLEVSLQEEKSGHFHDRTAFGVLSGLTRAAQNYMGNTRVEMECLSGDLLCTGIENDLRSMISRWENFEAAARNMGEDEVRSYAYVTK